MSRAVKFAALSEVDHTGLVLARARLWRQAKDGGVPTIYALYIELERSCQGMLAPVLDGLFSIFEAGLGRRFAAGATRNAKPTGDEMILLELLKDERASGDFLVTSMVRPFQGAVRSTQIMIAAVSRSKTEPHFPQRARLPMHGLFLDDEWHGCAGRAAAGRARISNR